MKMSAQFKRIIGFAIAAVILYFIAIRFAGYWGDSFVALKSANYPLMLAGVTLIALGFGFIAVIWVHLMKSIYGNRISLYRGLSYIFLPNIARYIPGKVWFVFGLAYFAKRWRDDLSQVITVTILAQLFYIFSGIVFGLLAVGPRIFEFLPIWVFPIFAVLLIFLFRPQIIHFVVSRLYRLINRDAKINIPPSLKIRDTIVCIFYGSLMWLMVGLGLILCVRAIYPGTGMELFLPLSGSYSLSYVLGYLSFITPAGLGVREFIMSVILEQFLDPQQIGLMVIVSRIWMMAAEIFLFACILIILYFKGELRSLRTVAKSVEDLNEQEN